MPTSRRGLSPLLLVLGLLAVLGAGFFFQAQLTRQAAGEVHRAQLASLARLQARSALADLRAQVAEDANRPGTPLFEKLRTVLDAPPARLDLAPSLRAPTRLLAPTWGKAGERGGEGSARGALGAWSATLADTRSARDVGGSDEWVARLELAVDGRMADAAGSARRTVRETYELRTVLAGPPRPFDQLGLYLGRLSVLTDGAAAQRTRVELLARHAELERRGRELPAELRAKLADVLSALAAADDAAARTPPLPEEDAAVWGFYESELALDRLDLARDVRRKLEASRAAESAATDEKGLRALVARHNEALNALWQYQRVLTIAPVASERFEQAIGRFLPRLEPAHFLDRAHLAFADGDPLFADWLAGRTRLEGVVDLTARKDRLTLRGDLPGRAVLLVGKAGADLADLNVLANPAGSRLTVVSLGGDVTVVGEVHAALIMLGAGRLTIPASARLTGSLIVPDPQASRLTLEGRLRYDGALHAAYPPAETLKRPGAGEYVIAVSPVPLYADVED